MLFPVEVSDLKSFDHPLQTIIQDYKSFSTPQKKPIFIHMLGVPGSGKTTFSLAVHQALSEKSFTRLGFDDVMQSIPRFNLLKSQNMEEAFAEYEIPARRAGYYILKNLILESKNILLDHGGSFENHIDILKYAKQEKQYQIIIVEINTDLDMAKTRLQKRSLQTGRHTPIHYVDERYEIIKSLIPSYKDIADKFFTFENNFDDDAIKLQNAAKEFITTL